MIAQIIGTLFLLGGIVGLTLFLYWFFGGRFTDV